MVEYKDRLAIALGSLPEKTLANHLGVSYQAVRKVLTGKSGALSATNNTRAAEFLGVSSDWLAIGEPYEKSRTPPPPAWPFQTISEAKVRALQGDDLARLEGAWAVTAMHIGIDVRQTRQSQAPQAPAETRPSVPAKRITPDGGGILYEKTIPPSNLSLRLRPGEMERSTADRASDPPKSKIRRFPK